MLKNCSTCAEWKLYMKNGNMCACNGLSSGFNPFSQLYTPACYSCDSWKKRETFNEFKKTIKIKHE
jgi:hypothetical protein